VRLLSEADPEIFESIQNEIKRQIYKLELIASENFVSEPVLQALGSVMTNKYAEGYPGRRYYGGCEHVDVAEDLARDRAKLLFGAEHANVQPHSGAQANMAAFLNFLKPGDTILGMNLSHGGHLTHGHPINFSGMYFNVAQYGVSQETEMIDYDELRDIALRENPKLIIAGASAYPRTIDFKKFREIADEVGAILMADMAHIAGLVATGLHPSPISHAHVVTSTTHKTLRGPRGGLILCTGEYAAGINKSVFPGIQGGPLMHVIAAKAVAFKEALHPDFKIYQEQVIKNAQALAKALINLGYKLVSGGTDNHLILVNLSKKRINVSNKRISGKKAERVLNESGITANKNTVPFDKRKPMITSGLRLGTPALTTRGMKEPEMEQISELIDRVISNADDVSIYPKVKAEVKELCEKFPLYADLLVSE